jgi:hypothetical protein
MLHPGLGVDKLKDAHALQVRDGAFAREQLPDRGGIDDPALGEATAKQAVADRPTKMIEQLRREPAWSPLDPPVEDQGWQLSREGAACE